MFARGATEGKVDMESYSEEAEDFTSDATNLDIWVLDRFKALLDRAKTNVTLDGQLRGPGTVIFLHLLGLDTTGHTYRPKSAEYVGNLMVVDTIAEQVERMLSDFYENDGKTAYVFTADHGMSNKGNHGDGEPDNTRTPLVAWGAGVRGPKWSDESQQWRDEEKAVDSYYDNWGQLDHSWRQDVDQADIAALMAAILGVNMPANSEGVVPLEYLDMPSDQAVRASLANALEVLEMYRVKHTQRSSRMVRYVPFSGLVSEGDEAPGIREVQQILQLIKEGNTEAALNSCKQLIQLSLKGAQYLQTYDWLLLVGIVLAGYLGSILYGFAFLLRRYFLSTNQLQGVKSDSGLVSEGRIVSGSVFILFIARFAAEQSPVTYYLYVAFAAYYWSRIIDENAVFKAAWRSALTAQVDTPRPALQLFLSIALRGFLGLVALEIMVYGYLQRLAWTAGFIVVGLVWPAVGISTEVKSRHDLLIILWTVSCGICGVLTLSSVEKDESVLFLVVSGALFLIAGVVIAFFPQAFLERSDNDSEVQLKRTMATLRRQLLMLVLSTIVTASSSLSLQQKKGLPLLNQCLAWFVLAFSLAQFGFQRTPQPASHRLICIIFGFAPIFVLLSIRDETIFFGCYCITLLLWGKLEGSLYEERQYANVMASKDVMVEEKNTIGRRLEKEDVRIAIFFLFFLHVGFFGTGNIASISSFYLSPVYRLIPIFSPFLMASLLLLKILTPFVILASTFQLICLTPPHPRANIAQPRKTGVQVAGPPLFGKDSVGGLGLTDAYSLVLLACISTDVLAVSFLVMVRTTGSWLEIGQTITHFAMANLLQVFMLALSAVAEFVIGG
jgi:phosphatidylinositol glycan class N